MNPFSKKGYVEIDGVLTMLPEKKVIKIPVAFNPAEPRPLENAMRHCVVNVEPCPAPRMTRSDQWRGLKGCKRSRRPIVQRYFNFRDAIRKAVGDVAAVPAEVRLIFRLPMPESWSETKKTRMDGQLHCIRPDGDNLTKAVLDSLFLEDGGVAIGHYEKRWARQGQVLIWY